MTARFFSRYTCLALFCLLSSTQGLWNLAQRNSEDSHECPESWYLYNYHCYRYGHTAYNWEAAREYCQDQGGDLAMPQDVDTYDFIGGAIGWTDSWFGLRKRWEISTEYYEWLDGTPLRDSDGLFSWNPYMKFSGSEPNVRRYGCVYLHSNAHAYSRPCTNNYRPLCQKVATPRVRDTRCFQTNKIRETGITTPVFGLKGKGMTQKACSAACQDNQHFPDHEYGFVFGEACFCTEPTLENLCPSDGVENVEGGVTYVDSATSIGEYSLNVTHNPYSCPENWEYFDRKCYRMYEGGRTWYDSRVTCRSWGGDLAIFRDIQEYEWFKHGFNAQYNSKHTHNYRGTDNWIGLRDASLCPSDWTAYDGHCYKNIGDYYYDEGQAMCKTWYHDSDMWTLVNNQTELDWVFAHPMGSHQESWMGLKRADDGEFYYADGTPLSSTGFASWHSSPGTEDCVRVLDKNWQTVSCTATQRRTICKYKLYPDGTGAWYDGSFLNETYHAFHKNEPSGSTSRFCTRVSSNGLWYDDDCNGGRWAFCQKEADFSNATSPDKPFETFDPLLVDITYQGGLPGLSHSLVIGNTDSVESTRKPQLQRSYTATAVSNGKHRITAETVFSGLKYEATLEIETWMSIRHANLSCPLYAIANTDFACLLEVLGSNVTAVVDYGDTEITLSVPDSPTYAIGFNFTGLTNPSSTWGQTNILVLNTQYPIEYTGKLYAFEVHMEARGAIEFMVYRPECESGQKYCHRSKSCIEESLDCDAQEPFRSYSCGGNKFGMTESHCLDGNGNEVVTTSTYDWSTVKSRVYRFSLVGQVYRYLYAEGYRYIGLLDDEVIPVEPGDLIAYYNRGGRVSFTNAPSGTSCYLGYNTNYDPVTSCSHLSYKYWFRGFVARNTEVQLMKNYPLDGVYNVTVALKGFLSADPVVASQEVNVIIPIGGTEILGSPYAAKDYEQQFSVNADHNGSTPMYEWDFGDGTDVFVTNLTEVTHTFNTSGVYNVTLLTSNAITHEVAFMSVICQEGIENLNLTKLVPVSPFGTDTEFLMGIDKGENVTWVVDWDDGNVSHFYDADGIGPQGYSPKNYYIAPLTFYWCEVTVSNQVSNSSAVIPLAVEVDIINLRFDYTAPVSFGSSAQVPFRWDTGTGANFSTTHNGADYANFAVNESDYTGVVTLAESDYSVIGEHDVGVMAVNLLGERTADTSFWIDHSILGLNITSNTSYVRPGEVAGFTITMDTGSRMNLTTNFDDGLEYQEHVALQLASRGDETFISHAWAAKDIGFPTVNVSIVNPVSTASITHPMTVQFPVDGLTLSTNHPVFIWPGEPGTLNMYINKSETLAIPTAAFHNYTFGVSDMCDTVPPPTLWEQCQMMLETLENATLSEDGPCLAPVAWSGTNCSLHNYAFDAPSCVVNASDPSSPVYSACMLPPTCDNETRVSTFEDETCVFPFTINGTVYTNCTLDDDEFEFPSCGVVSNGVVNVTDNSTWGECDFNSTRTVPVNCVDDTTLELFDSMNCSGVLQTQSAPVVGPCNADAAEGAIVDSMWDVLDLTSGVDMDSFNYTDFGTYRVTLNVSNFVSHMYWDFKIDVDQPVMNLTIWCDDYILEYDTSTTCHMNMTWGSRVNLKYVWMDEAAHDEIAYNMTTENNHEHRFSYEGVHDVTVYANNTLDTWAAVIPEPVIVQHVVQEFTLKPVNYISLLEDPDRAVAAEFDLFIQPNTTFPTNASYSITFGDGGTASGRLSGHIRTVNGNKCVFSGVEECTRQSADAEPSCTVSGGGTELCSPRTSGYVYTTGGNANGARCVFPTIKDGELVNSCFYDNSDQFVCATTSNFDNDGIWGLCDPDDYGMHENNLDQGDLVHVTRLSHVYEIGDTYNVTIAIWNEVSNETYDCEHIVYDGISGLLKDILWVDYDYAEEKEVLKPAFTGADKVTANYYPLEKPLEFRSNYSRGSHLYFGWNFGDGNLETVFEELTIRHTYDEPGTYIVFLNVSNFLTWQVVQKRIIIQRSVLEIGISCVSPQPKNRTVEFNVDPGKMDHNKTLGRNACYRFDFKDIESEIWYIAYAGYRSMCNFYYADEMTAQLRYFALVEEELMAAKESTGSANFTITNIFMTRGAFLVHMTGINFVSRMDAYWRTGITNGPCSWPDVDLRDANKCLSPDMCKAVRTDPSRPEVTDVKVHHRSKRLIVKSAVKLKCESTKIAWFQWVVSRVNADGSETEVEFDEPLNSTELNSLDIEPRYLEYGLYKFWLNVSMDQEQNIENQDTVYILIDKTPLAGKMADGIKVRTKWGENFTFNAIGGIVDPDFPEDKNFTFKWLCKRSCEKWPLFDDDYNALSYLPSNCSVEDDGNGGCFRTPDFLKPGKFDNSTEGLLTRDLTYAYEPDQIKLLVIAYKDTRQIILEQFVDIINGDPPTLSVRCVTNCGDKVNYAKRFSLQAELEASGGFEYNWAWLLYRFVGGEYIEEPQYLIDEEDWASKEQVSTGIDTPSMSLDEGKYFQADDIEYLFYFAVRAYRKLGNPNNYGEAMYQVEVNEAPIPGNCTISPQIGTALNESYTVTCPDSFVDIHLPLTYDLFSRTNPAEGEDGWSPLTSGSNPDDASFQLAQGLEEYNYTVEVAVRATDNIGGSTTVIVTVQSYPISDPEGLTNVLNDFVNNKGELADLGAAADANTLCPKFTAILSNLENTATQEEAEWNTTYNYMTTVSVTMTPEEIQAAEEARAEEVARQNEQGKAYREAMMNSLSKVQCRTPASCNQLVGTASAVTKNPNQVSPDTQKSGLAICDKATDAIAQIKADNGGKIEADAVASVASPMVNSLGAIAEASATTAKTDGKSGADVQKGVSDTLNRLTGLTQDTKVGKETPTVLGGSKLKATIYKSYKEDLTGGSMGTDRNSLLLGGQDGIVGTGNDTIDVVVPSVVEMATNPFVSPNDTTAGTNTSITPNSNVLILRVTNTTGGSIENMAGPQPPVHIFVSQQTPKERKYVQGTATKSGKSFGKVHQVNVNKGGSLQLRLNRIRPNVTDNSTDISLNLTTLGTSTTPSSLEYNFTDTSGGFKRNVTFTCHIGINRHPSPRSSDASCVLPIQIKSDENNNTYAEGGGQLPEGECALDSPNGTCKSSYFNQPPAFNATDDSDLSANSTNATMDMSYLTDQFSSREALENVDTSSCLLPHTLLKTEEDVVLRIGVEYAYTEEYSVTVNDSDGTTTPSSARRRRSVDSDSSTNSTEEEEEPVLYAMDVAVAKCQYWNEYTQEWSSEGCEVGPESTLDKTHCICTVLAPPAPTTYNESDPSTDPDNKYTPAARAGLGLTLGAGLVIPINSINFQDSAFNNLDDNPLVFSVMVSCMCLYLCLLIWAKKADRDDAVKAGASPLLDNDPRDQYIYELTVFTGSRTRGGTSAKVSVVFAGEEDETPPRLIFDDKRPVLRRGGVDSFIMATPRPLGPMTHIRVWHDNSGPSPSWFFSRMQVINMQTMEKYFFICDRWLAVDEDDGIIDRIVPLAGKEELTSFNHLFMTKAKRDLSDGHVWFSVFARPHKNPFTRCQRLTCCLSLLFCTMTGNILFYNNDGTDNGPSQTILGIRISVQSLLTGLIASLLVFPINLVIIFIFKLSAERVKKLKPEKTADEIAKEELKQQATFLDADKAAGTGTPFVVGSRVSFNNLAAIKEGKKKTPKVKQGFKLQFPWWFIYIGYFLCLCTIGTSFWVTVEIAGVFGPEKSEEWMISFATSICESIFLSQPIKVFGVALFWALIIRKPTPEDGDPGLKKNEHYLHSHKKTSGARPAKFRRYMGKYRAVPLPPTEEYLLAARRQRLKEIQMMGVLREIFFYIVFLYLLMMVSYGNKDPWSGVLYESLKNEFSEGVYGDGPPAEETNEYKSFWSWTQETFVPAMYSGPMYNGESYDWQEGFTSDRNMFVVGVPRLRQLRVVSEQCVMPVYKYEKTCQPSYFILDEDEGKYRKNWVKVNESDPVDIPDPGWYWQSTADLEGFPYTGEVSAYGGGGFSVELGHKRAGAEAILADLKETDWLNKDTRAVFVEFVLYNPNMNLFAVSFILFEFMGTGAAIPNFRMQLIRLDRYIGTYMLAVLGSEILTFIYIIVFIVTEAKLIKKKKSKYFKEFWNVIEFVTLLLCLLAMALFFYRFYVAHTTREDFKANKFGYVNFMLAAYWDEVYGYILACIIFIANVKFLKLLRFNKKISMLGQTLSYITSQLLSFMLALLVVFIAFAQLSYIVYARLLLSFSTFLASCETLFTLMLNKFDYQELETANPVFAPIIFFSFTIFVTFVLVNFMLTIIVEGFASVQEALKDQENEYEIVDFVVGQFKGLLGMGAGKKMPPMRNETEAFVGEQHGELMSKFEEFEEKFRDFYEDEAEGEKDEIDKCEQQIKKQRLKSRARTIYTT